MDEEVVEQARQRWLDRLQREREAWRAAAREERQHHPYRTAEPVNRISFREPTAEEKHEEYLHRRELRRRRAVVLVTFYASLLGLALPLLQVTLPAGCFLSVLFSSAFSFIGLWTYCFGGDGI